MAPLVGTLAFLTPKIVLMVSYAVSYRLDRSADAAYSLRLELEFLELEAYVVVVFAFGATVLLGLPIYYLLHKTVSVTPALSVLVGWLVACTPLLILTLGDGMALFFDHYDLLARVSGGGLIGGLIFWLCAFWRGPALINVRP